MLSFTELIWDGSKLTINFLDGRFAEWKIARGDAEPELLSITAGKTITKAETEEITELGKNLAEFYPCYESPESPAIRLNDAFIAQNDQPEVREYLTEVQGTIKKSSRDGNYPNRLFIMRGAGQ